MMKGKSLAVIRVVINVLTDTQFFLPYSAFVITGIGESIGVITIPEFAEARLVTKSRRLQINEVGEVISLFLPC